MDKQRTADDIKPVRGSEDCVFSVIENKLAAISQNQQVIYSALIEVLERLRKVEPVTPDAMGVE